MQLKYKISVIIPTFNAEDYLLEAFESIKNQSMGFESIEVILVDDKSSDKTPDLIKELSKEYENVKSIILEENTGTASGPRNKGIEESSADYVIFLDNDDILYPEMCQKLYETIKNEEADIVNCRYNIDSKNSSKSPNSFLDKFNPNDYPDFKGEFDKDKQIIRLNSIYDFPNIMALGYTTMIWNKIFRKSTILENNIQFPLGDLYEDAYFTSKFYLHARKIILLNDFYGYGYQLRTEGENKSFCQTFSSSMIHKTLKGFLEIMKILQDKKEFEIFKSELIVDLTKIFIYSDLNKQEQKEFLEIMKPYYNEYPLSQKIQTTRLAFNYIINIFIKIFAKSTRIPILIADLYKRIPF